MSICGRTDLASEAHALWKRRAEETTELPGVRARAESVDGLELITVEILDERGEQTLGKSRGLYFTMKLPEACADRRDHFADAVSLLAGLLRRCGVPARGGSVLVAALGNPDITPDAIGSLTAESVLVTRHLKESRNALFEGFRSVALCRTGVLGTTGVESAAQIRALCEQLKPDCVIAVDALAGAEWDGLCRSVQICSSGIAPGSGVGNDRLPLSRETLGVPVIALGVPTVIDAASLTDEPGFRSMFVTPRDIDSDVRQLGRLLGFGINLALHDGLTLEDMELLLA